MARLFGRRWAAFFLITKFGEATCGRLGCDFSGEASESLAEMRMNLAEAGSSAVTGVLFFDRLDGQSGVAPNGVELHPVPSVESAS
jgi:hypothetical protein